MAKTALPQEIQQEMKLYRIGMAPISDKYIEFHQKLAERELEFLVKYGLEVESQSMESDGWMDGMKALQVVGWLGNEKVTLQWHDGNQEFFKDYENCGGSSPFRFCESHKFLTGPFANLTF